MWSETLADIYSYATQIIRDELTPLFSKYIFVVLFNTYTDMSAVPGIMQY